MTTSSSPSSTAGLPGGVRGRRAGRLLSAVFTVAVVLYLARELSQVGWHQVLASVPASPWFYLVFLALYAVYPLAEAGAYRRLWGVPAARLLPPLLRKRAYSRYLLDYSGEAYLFLWARRRVQLPERRLLLTIKDNVVLSTGASMAVGLLLLAALLATGRAALPAELAGSGLVRPAGAALLVVALGALAVRFRRRILSVPPDTARILLAIHAGRLLLFAGLEVLAWTAAVPAVPLESWLSLLSVEVVVSRIPFVPARDLIFVSTGIRAAGAIGVAAPLLAGTLLTVSVLDKLLNLMVFALLGLVRPDRLTPGPADLSAAQERPEGAAAP